jgi:hypothetical protein
VSAFQWNFRSRDFPALYSNLNIFNLLYKGQSHRIIEAGKNSFMDMWVDPRSQLSIDLTFSFQDIFIAMIRRISESDDKPMPGVD